MPPGASAGPSPGTPPGATLAAALGLVTWFALVIAALGFLSLALDADVVPESDAGPALGAVLLLLAGAALFLLLRRWMRTRPAPTTAFLVAAVVVYAIHLTAGTIGYTLISARLGELVAYPIRHAISPFLLAVAALAGVVAIIVPVMYRSRRSGRPRGRWPWEGEDEP